MVHNGIIEESSRPWASPIVLVKKKDGSTRFCVDYRELNEITIKDCYPLPRIDDTLDALNGSQWFSTLDLKSGYWQVEIQPEDKEKTAFTTGQGLWQFKRLQNANLKLSPKKCRFFRKEVSYLGCIISADGVKTDPEKTKTLVDWPRPEPVHDLRSVLGLCTYYRRFVRNFSAIARPLHKLTEARSSFNWTEECEKSFSSLKQALITSPILTYPRTDKEFILDTDASNEGTGAVPAKNNLQKICREPEGQIARWIQTLQEYDFEIQHGKGTSHGNADVLSRRPCKESCKHCTNAEKKFGMETDISVKVLTTEDTWSSSEVQKAQLEDLAIRPILEKKLNSEDRPSWQEIAPESPAKKRYWAFWDSLHLKDGVLYRKWESDDGISCRWQLILPKSRIQEVLRETHDSASGGHFGVMKTLNKTRERFYWDRLRADVEKWCRECHACESRKGPKTRTKGRLQR
ncbi:Transposon Ty3-G Gag-Pol polyprotein [Araneus ventricosus]|uniref:RNA-directed DNA polymerase n=1 Tax=Araneus ventricosus TaxID=182803 RepID=A0A4Y2T8B7_ARAVE|nr:Transposon Ty3-G Gag-Pol polyprotein [Araneus ventricosus]